MIASALKTSTMLGLLMIAATGFSVSTQAGQPMAECSYLTSNTEIELVLNGVGIAEISGDQSGTKFSCQAALVNVRDCRRCASVVKYILTLDRSACQISGTADANLSDRISLHVYNAQAELGFFNGKPRLVCSSYFFDEEKSLSWRITDAETPSLGRPIR